MVIPRTNFTEITKQLMKEKRTSQNFMFFYLGMVIMGLFSIFMLVMLLLNKF